MPQDTPKASLIDCFTMCKMPHGLAALVVLGGSFFTFFLICYVSFEFALYCVVYYDYTFKSDYKEDPHRLMHQEADGIHSTCAHARGTAQPQGRGRPAWGGARACAGVPYLRLHIIIVPIRTTITGILQAGAW